jgi:hypothetical protein
VVDGVVLEGSLKHVQESVLPKKVAVGRHIY